MKITQIKLERVHGHYEGPTFTPYHRQAQALDIYSEFNGSGAATMTLGEPGPISALYVEIQTDASVTGLYGPISDYQAYVITKTLRPFLLGRDPLATEALLDQMLRLERHGRTGYFVTGVSAVDCALWDLRGKVWGEPVYRLLGGPTRKTVPAYASLLGYSLEPTAAAATAKDYVAKGFQAQKWFLRHGPASGAEGKEANLALAHAVREAVGPHHAIMFDVFRGWTESYAIELGRLLAPLRPTWLEEPVFAEQIESMRKIRKATGIPLATGEHVYTRWQAKELLTAEAVDVLQNDPDWTGGITELVKICALGSAFGVTVAPHGHSLLPALHIAASQSPATVPWVEYLVSWQEIKQWFHKRTYRPLDGSLELPQTPGLGLELDEEKIHSKEEI